RLPRRWSAWSIWSTSAPRGGRACRTDTAGGIVATMAEPTGLLVMAYGTASGPDDVERYYTDIRGGRPPAPEHLAELRARYAAIGDRFPLLDITRAQARGVERELNAAAGGGS